MPVRRLGLEADFDFKAGPYSKPDMRIVRFEGREGISELFHFQLQLVLEDREADFDAIVGKPGLLTIEGSEGTRYVSGIVSRFEQSSEATRLTQYSAELVPKIWLLDNRRNSRIFQEMTVPDIIKKVLSDAKIPPDEYQFKVKRSYQPREYCVQYRESDLAFISRLMEEEGIFYWFQHSEDKHVLTMGDAQNIIDPIAGDPKLDFYEVSGEEPEQEHVYFFRYSQEVRPGEVVLRDFDFKKPALDLTTSKAADHNKELQYYDFPGEYFVPSEGKDLSNIRLEEFQAFRQRTFGRSTCRRLIPGFKYTLQNHRRDSFNKDYLITQVFHVGSQVQAFKEAAGTAMKEPEYRNQYRCIPAEIPFRPPRVTPRPVVHGSQTAIVAGPAGEEIHCDQYGRVKVQFHWDRDGKNDDKSSCWIRVSQAWAGGSWGGMMIPRIGQEVVIEFLEGDPDRPIIMGRVYNGANSVPYALPGSKSVGGVKSNSTPGGGGYNEFILDDTKGNELIRVHGQYDMDSTIENDLREHVLNDRSRDVTNNETIQIGVDQTYSIGSNQTGTVGADKTIEVKANHTESVGANKQMKIGGNHTESIGGNMNVTVSGNLTESVSVAYSETVGASMTLTVGSAMQQQIGAAYALTVGGAMSASIGSSSSLSVGGASSVNVATKASENIGAAKTVNVGGNLSETIGGKQSANISSDLSESVGGKHTENVSAAYSLTAETVKITGKSKITLVVGSSQIELTSSSIKIKANKIEISGTQEVKTKAMKVASEASASNDLKGAMVTVDASGVNTIKGALVKIN